MRHKLFFLIIFFLGFSNSYSEEIVYGLVPDASPTTFVDEDGNPSGFLIELFSRIMDELDISYRYEVDSVEKLYPKMVSGEIDLFTTLLKNPEREKLFYYPDIPALSGWGQLFVATDTDYSEIGQLNGKRIGILQNDINGRNFKQFASNLGIIYTIIEYESIAELFKSVKSGEVYAGVIYSITLVGTEGIKSTSTVFNPLPGYAVTAKNSDFIKDLDRIMIRFHELRNNQKSYYYDLLAKWINPSERINRKIFQVVIIISVLLSIIILVMYLINRYLKHEVFLRTQDLELSNRIVSSISEGIILTDPDGSILKVNPGFIKITGYEEAEVLGKNPSILQSGSYDEAFYKNMWSSLFKNGFWKGELINKRKNGDNYFQSTSIVSIMDQKGRITNFASIIADDTLRHSYEEQLQYQANHDILTDLSNRRYFSIKLSETVTSAGNDNCCLSLVLIDIDNFKNFNDAYGHHQGDKLLKSVASYLDKNLSESCYLFRLGGDEFSVVALAENRNEAEKIIPAKIINLFRNPFEIDKNIRVHITASLGVAVYPYHAKDSEELYTKADLALNLGKKEGRGLITSYREDMDLPVQKRIKYESLIRLALERNEIRVFYQPKLDLDKKKISGVEALVRWELENEIMIPPDEFISVAEETGMIIPIGEYVLRQTCLDIKELSEQIGYSLSAAVNLSGIQFTDPELDRIILDIVEETSFNPKYLELEITESVAVNHLEELYSILGRLRENNIKIAMDDFGTGFSSLSYLKDLPLDILKIDKAFTLNIPDIKQDTEVVKLIISMADILDLKVIAEGVESVRQLDYLVSQNCREIQGYVLSPPVNFKKLKKIFSDFNYSQWLDNINK